MRVEIQSASNFLTNLLRLKYGSSTRRLELFSAALEQLLGEHYSQHWFPEAPCKGSGYRCIRINHKMDPILSRAGARVGIDEEGLRELFPSELTLWIDPREVSYRIGENGSICVLYEGTPNWTPSTPRNVSRRRHTTSSDDDSSCSSTSCSPMSTSCSPSDSCFLMDPRNIELELSHFVDS